MPRPVVAEDAEGIRAEVVLDGHATDRDLRWTAEGARIVRSSGTSAWIEEGFGPWTLSADLVRRDRVLATGTIGGGGAPRVVAGGGRLLIGGGKPPGAVLEVWEGAALDEPEAGGTVSIRWTLPGGRTSPWSTATAGSLPGRPSRRLPLDPLACGDPDFPRRAGGGHVACSQDADPHLGLWLPEDAQAPEPIAPPLLPGRADPTPIAPGGAAVSMGPEGTLIWVDDELGSWLPGSAGAAARVGRRAMGRPASDGVSVAFLGPDRLEIGPAGGAQRFQVPASPAETAGNLAVGRGVAAWVEQRRGGRILELHDATIHRGARLADGDVGSVLIAGAWLAWTEADCLRALCLDGGLSHRLPREPGQGMPAVLDDWLIAPLRSGRLAALHLPTGLSLDVETGVRIAEPRGASGGRLTTWLREPGTAGDLFEWDAVVRVFEEDGPASSGDLLAPLPGGHGGRRGALAPNGERSVRLDPGPGSWVLEAWVGGGESRPAPEVALGGRRLGTPALVAGPSEPEPGAWTVLARFSASSRTPWAERELRVTWTAGPDGAIVDALRLRPGGSA